jgi:hypothetical protein
MDLAADAKSSCFDIDWVTWSITARSDSRFQ